MQAAAEEKIGRSLSLTAKELSDALSAERFVSIRTIFGGPAPDETRRALADIRAGEDRDESWRSGIGDSLAAAEKALRDCMPGTRQ
jgi:argininosuccinate lyase